MLSTVEREFILSAIEKGVREDGRSANSLRPLRVSFLGEEGSGRAEIQLGRTRVLSVASAEAVRPLPDRPREGFLSVNVDLSPMADDTWAVGVKPSGREFSSLLEGFILDSKAIDVESLCVVPEVSCLSIRVDLTVVDNFGDLLCALSIAAVASLLHFRRPDVLPVGESGVATLSASEGHSVPLSIHHSPVCLCFAVYDDVMRRISTAPLMDPDVREESVMKGFIAISVNNFEEVCGVWKSGGEAVLQRSLDDCFREAAAEAKEIFRCLKDALQEDSAKRRLRKERTAEATGVPSAADERRLAIDLNCAADENL